MRQLARWPSPLFLQHLRFALGVFEPWWAGRDVKILHATYSYGYSYSHLNTWRTRDESCQVGPSFAKPLTLVGCEMPPVSVKHAPGFTSHAECHHWTGKYRRKFSRPLFFGVLARGAPSSGTPLRVRRSPSASARNCKQPLVAGIAPSLAPSVAPGPIRLPRVAPVAGAA